MTDLGFTINVAELPDAQDFSPLPMDNYQVVFTNTKLIPTNKTKDAMAASGTDDFEAYRRNNPKAELMLNLEMDVQGDKYSGRKLFHNLNLINDSEQASQVAQGQLKQILTAVGIKALAKTDELHGKRALVSVIVEPAKPYVDKKTGQQKPGVAQNKCTKFMAGGSVANQAAAVTQATATASDPKAPWRH